MPPKPPKPRPKRGKYGHSPAVRSRLDAVATLRREAAEQEATRRAEHRAAAARKKAEKAEAAKRAQHERRAAGKRPRCNFSVGEKRLILGLAKSTGMQQEQVLAMLKIARQGTLRKTAAQLFRALEKRNVREQCDSAAEAGLLQRALLGGNCESDRASC
jgi:hypothetical protein